MTDRITDVVCYLLLMGLLQGTLLFALIVLLLPLTILKNGAKLYQKVIGHAATFNIVLLFFGCIGNSMWMLLTYKRFYVSADTFVDYFPFYPFGQWVLDVSFGNFTGRLLGPGTIFHLQWVWAAITLFVWCASCACHLKLAKILRVAAQQLAAADQPSGSHSLAHQVGR